MYLFPRTAVTKHHKLAGLTQQIVSSPTGQNAGGLKSSCWLDHVLFVSTRVGSFVCLPASGSSRSVACGCMTPSLPPFSHDCPLYVSPCYFLSGCVCLILSN